MSKEMPSSFGSFAEQPTAANPTRQRANELIGRQIELENEQRGGPHIPEEEIVDSLVAGKELGSRMAESKTFRWRTEHAAWMHDAARYLESSTSAEARKTSELFLQALRHHIPSQAKYIEQGIASELAAKQFLEQMGCKAHRTLPIIDAGLGIDMVARANTSPDTHFTIQIKSLDESRVTKVEGKGSAEDIFSYPDVDIITPEYLQKMEKQAIEELNETRKQSLARDLASLRKCYTNTIRINKRISEAFMPIAISVPPFHTLRQNMDHTNLHLAPVMIKNWKAHFEKKWSSIISHKKENI